MKKLKTSVLVLLLLGNLGLVSVLGYLGYQMVGLVSLVHNKIEIYEQYRQEEMATIKDSLCELANLTVKQGETQSTYNQVVSDYLQAHTDAIVELAKHAKWLDQMVTEKLEPIDLAAVETIKAANFTIMNVDIGAQGSGTHIKIDGRSYILTCAHLVDNHKKDLVVAIDDDGDWMTLQLVKYNQEKDLALFRFLHGKNLPYLEVSDIAPKVGSKVLVIGNPDGLEDVVTEGILSKVEDDVYLLTNLVYFGNSGGALLYKGKVVGVLSRIVILFNGDTFVNFSLSVSLEDIQKFLANV